MNKLYIAVRVLLVLLVGAMISSSIVATTDLEPLVIDGTTIRYYNSAETVMIPTIYTEQETEFRGVWVATVYNLNIAKVTSEVQYKAAFSALLDEVEESNMNAIVFQVRAQNDAWYDSAYAPWSRWVTGTEGVDPGWDVMAYMIQEAHSRGIEFHAWLNPYRVANTTSTQTAYINTLHAENFAKQRPDLVVSGNVDSSNRNPLILNPGEPEVKAYIRNVITELVNLYDVDGIHFDDYFYPYSGINLDTSTYDTYKLPGQAIDDWRRENVNDVVRGVKEDIDAYNLANGKDVRFGISPPGVWKSGGTDGSNTSPFASQSYNDLYADSKKWVEEGWVHYIAPQIYRNFEHSLVPYADIVDWWANVTRGTGVDLLIGHATYLAYDYNWDTDEISKQLRYNQQHPEIKGSIMYSANYFDTVHMQYIEANNWTVAPLNVWQSSTVPSPVIDVTGTLEGNEYISDVTFTVSGDETLYYKINNGEWIVYTTPITLTEEGTYAIYAKQINALDEESLIVGKNVVINKVNSDIPVIDITGSMIGSNYVIDSVVTITATNPIWVAINHGSVGAWVPYTGPITLDDTGGYYIQSKTINSEGIESEVAIRSVTVQQNCYDNPSIAITGTGTAPIYQSATITLSGDSPVIQYKINDGSYQSYSAPFVLNTEGDYTITYKNDDACAVEQSTTLTIDQTAPEVPALTIVGDYDGERYYTSTTTLSLSTDESDSTIYFRLHNGSSWTAWAIFETPLVLEYTGTFTLEYYAIDGAGNTSETLDQRIRMDIPPTENNLYVIRDGQPVTYYGTSIPIELPTEYTEKTKELRGIWIATVSNIDLKQYTNEADYKNTIIQMLDEIERNNFNAVFFQVRPMNDAWYDSDYAPWSRYLMGVEGNDPGWDVLGFIIEECHKRGIEFHAWLNPYRVSTGTDSKTAQLALLDDDNFAKQHPELVIQDTAGKLILNPGEPQVRAYILNVILELMTKYDVDGIHFDDYFYSYNGTNASEDSSAFSKYNDDSLSLDDWRRENINIIVKDIFDAVEAHNLTHDTHIKFGISPFGIWKSGGVDGSNTSPYTFQSYSGQYADSKKWVEEGWLHYILPQLYWEFDHSSAPFADLVDWWASVCEGTGVDLIIGQGFYRYDDDSWTDDNELLEQIRYMTKYDVIIGSSFFSYKVLLSSDPEVVQAKERLNEYYWTEYPEFPWDSDVTKSDPVICDDGYHEENGVCVVDPVVCEDGYHEEGGVCVVDSLICEDGTHEENGVCVEDPVTCEDGYILTDGECIKEEPKKTGCFSTLSTTSSIVTIIIGLLGTIILLRKRT